jgi:integrase
MKQLHKPGKGCILKVDPIRSPSKIRAIKLLLSSEPRNLLLFILGINTNLRMCDLLSIQLGQVRGLSISGTLTVRESKTGKIHQITLNRFVWESLHAWLAKCHGLPDETPLFWSRKTGASLQVSSVNNLIKDWCKTVGLEGRFGCHSLRKTFGFHHRTRFGTDLPTLMVMFNHSNQRQTLNYLGIQSEEISAAYRHEI